MRLLYSIHRYDVSMFVWLLQSKHRPLYTRICRYISLSGDGYLYLLLAATLYWMHDFRAMQGFYCIILAFTLERPLYFVIKNSCKRNRPAEAVEHFQSSIVPSDRFSFPSGHTSAAFLIATLGAAFYPSVAFPLYAWAALVGMARVVLGVHFPSDTLAGAAMGSAVALYSLETIAA